MATRHTIRLEVGALALFFLQIHDVSMAPILFRRQIVDETASAGAVGGFHGERPFKLISRVCLRMGCKFHHVAVCSVSTLGKPFHHVVVQLRDGSCRGEHTYAPESCIERFGGVAVVDAPSSPRGSVFGVVLRRDGFDPFPHSISAVNT